MRHVDCTCLIPPAGSCAQGNRTETPNGSCQRKAELNRAKLDLSTGEMKWTAPETTKQTKDEYSPLDESQKQHIQKFEG